MINKRKIIYLCSVIILLCSPFDLYGFSIQEQNTIIDELGRKIKIEQKFNRIISLYGAHTENLFYMGAETQIIGVSMNEVFPPGAKNKPVFSYHDDPEKVLAAGPDLLLIRPMIDRGYSKLMTRLEKSGITVISLQPTSVNDMFEYWKILGALTGKEKESIKMVSEFKNKIVSVKKMTQNIKQKKRVYFEAIHKKMKTFTPDSMAVFVLETSGGINIAGDAKQVRNTNIAYYGKERILSHASEIDVYIAQKGVMNNPSISMIKNETGFSIIKAIKNNHIFIIDEMIVSRPGMRLLNGIYEIGCMLYPEVFYENKNRG